MKIRLFLLLCFSTIVITALSVSAQTQASVTLSDLTLHVGESGVLEADIDCRQQCSAFEILMQFDNTKLHVDSVELGSYLGDANKGQVFVAKNEVDNENGFISIAAASLGTSATAPQDMRLLIIHLTALQAGNALFRISRLQLGDLSGKPLKVPINYNAIVTILALPTSTPSPTPTRPSATPTSQESVIVTVKIASANLRSGPGTDYTVVGSVTKDTGLIVIAQTQDGSWYLIEEGNGNKAWLAASLTDIHDSSGSIDSSSIPIAATIPPTPPHVFASPTAVTASSEDTISFFRIKLREQVCTRDVDLKGKCVQAGTIGFGQTNGPGQFYLSFPEDSHHYYVPASSVEILEQCPDSGCTGQ